MKRILFENLTPSDKVELMLGYARIELEAAKEVMERSDKGCLETGNQLEAYNRLKSIARRSREIQEALKESMQ